MGIKMRMKLFICPLVGKMNWRCFSFLRMVTPSHIFGVPRKDPGHGAHRKVSVTLKPPYITVYKPHRVSKLFGLDQALPNNRVFYRSQQSYELERPHVYGYINA